MTFLASLDPAVHDCAHAAVDVVLEARATTLDGFSIGRVLPSARRRMVGPFIFFDHMGPAAFAPGEGFDVPPHPHINLATVTYLFEGEIFHRDTLGSAQSIQPGAINWMNAGRGIAHSERTPIERRVTGDALHGVQLWVALPDDEEESAPSFDHYPAESLPEFNVDGVPLRLLAGSGWGRTSPVKTKSPLIYADVQLRDGDRVPLPDEHAELALYIVEGELACGETFGARKMIVLNGAIDLHATTPTRVMLLGGAPVGKRHIWWNFVSSSRERIEQAKREWLEMRYGLIPGDERELVPLPAR
ncbi:MAG TPA: pirin family protein [Thermoanaerobaculia bacterium]|nr:pirin family protein [Thermoanaerobaculia bacterium]